MTMITIMGAVWRGIVADCPPELHECETCRELECTQGRFAACERRLIMTELSKRQTED